MLAALLTAFQAVAVPQTLPPVTVYNGRAMESTVRIPRRAEANVLVDGALNEAEWQQAPLLTGFTQYQPVDGLPAADSTEILVWYTDHDLYLGVRAFEPHGQVSATLADRDRIFSDDYVLFMIDTFNDRRSALAFGVNPLGVQADGVMNESQRGSSEDYSPDYLFESKGRVTDYGFEVEIRIPFKSLRYPSARVQDWGLSVFRRVQHSGQSISWTPLRQSVPSVLSQAGTLTGMTGMKRGLVMDINPVATTKLDGVRQTDPVTNSSTYRYGDPVQEFGGNVRWGVTSNLTMNATFNPDFSQVEADIGQVNFDPRQALFFPEKRPFFLESSDAFRTPRNLIHTRRIVAPDVAVKFTGTVSGISVGLLSAADDRRYSTYDPGSARPYYNLLRVRGNVGQQSSLGVTYTDKIDGENYNRVASLDGRMQLGTQYTLAFQTAGSFWHSESPSTGVGRTVSVPLWDVSLDKSGRNMAFGASFGGMHQDFVAGAGFISRPGIVRSNINPRFHFYRTPESALQRYTFGLVYDNTWDYDEFTDGAGPDDIKLHLNNSFVFRGGWNLGVNFFLETFRYPDQIYRNYFVQKTDTSGDTILVPFRGRRRIPNYDVQVSLNTPQANKFSGFFMVVTGRDENFEEWAPGYIVITEADGTYRPTDKARLSLRYVEQRTMRRDDWSNVRLSRIPRVKVEYQVSRPFFVRLVGQYTADQRDKLRDVEGGGEPIFIRTGPDEYWRGNYRSGSFRGDVLLSYQPNPGTVIFAGYGSSAEDSDPFAFRRVTRTSDGLFLKVSYLFRL